MSKNFKSLEEILEEQVLVEFTGQLRLLDNLDFRELGFLLFKNGRIIDGKFENKVAERAFTSALIHQERIKVVVEAEIVNQPSIITRNYRELIEGFEDALMQHKYYEYFTVPVGIKLEVNPNFLRKGADLTRDEYAILLTLNKNVSDALFTDLNLLDYEVTKNLISLRKKHALLTTKKVEMLTSTKELRV